MSDIQYFKPTSDTTKVVSPNTHALSHNIYTLVTVIVNLLLSCPVNLLPASEFSSLVLYTLYNYRENAFVYKKIVKKVRLVTRTLLEEFWIV